MTRACLSSAESLGPSTRDPYRALIGTKLDREVARLVPELRSVPKLVVEWVVAHPVVAIWGWCAALALLFFSHPLLNGLVLAPTDILYGYGPGQSIAPKSFVAHNG